MDSDSDADLADYAPSGLSQNSHTSESPITETKERIDPIREEEPVLTSANDILRRAQRFVDKLQVPEEITSVNQLAWHRYKWKKSANHLIPVRIGSKDMIIGLNVQQNFDETKKSAIEYLSCLKDCIGKRNVAPKSQLLPYGDSNEWNPELMLEYLKTLGDGKLTDFERRKEEMYLDKILKVVCQRDNERAAIKQEPLQTLVASDMEVETDDAVRIPNLSFRVEGSLKTEPLKAGDAIEYYRSVSKAGDKNALTQAFVLSVQPGDVPLKLHNDEILPSAHSVKRIFTSIRGSYVDLRSTGTYRAIRSFKLARSELRENDPVRQMLASANSPMDAILERNFAEFEQKVKDSGCENLMDMISWTSKKRAAMGEIVDQRPAKRSKSELDDGANGTGSETNAKSSVDEAIEVLNAQLETLRSLSGRQRAAATYMTEDMLELAIQVRQHLMSPDSELSLEDLATKLCLSEYALKHFLCGDELKLIRLPQHEETQGILQQWIDKSSLH